MGLQEWTTFWLVLAMASMSLAAGAAMDGFQARVHHQCSLTMNPNHCVATLMELLGSELGSRSTHDPHVDLVSALVTNIISQTKQLPTIHETSKLAAQDAKLAHAVTDYCNELMEMSLKRLEQSLLALKNSPQKNKADIQTWLSAAMTFQQACKDSADEARATLISQKMDHLSQLSSYPLALFNHIMTGNNNTTVNNKNRRIIADHDHELQHHFPNWVSGRTRKLLQATTVKANVVVAKDGSGNYRTVSEAIKAAIGNRFVIYVKAGVYKEKIHANKDGITLIGDGKYSTIIVGDDSVAGGASTAGSATFTITGDGFIARDIGFQNTAGPQGEQALALCVASDLAVFYRCSIAGYQDTLCAIALRQFYRECDIYGTIDFIFGNAAAVFQSCNLVLRRPGHGGNYNVILAQGRSDPGQNTGFSVQNCRVTAGSDFSPVKHSFESFLGRPWKKYSRAVVMESTIDDAIVGKGWVQWPGAGGSLLKTLYFAEYSNSGPGAGTSGRVQWPGFHVIGAQEAGKFTVANFIAGTSWLPSTGVAFTSGLL